MPRKKTMASDLRPLTDELSPSEHALELTKRIRIERRHRRGYQAELDRAADYMMSFKSARKPGAKLDDKMVREMRADYELDEMTIAAIARKYLVTYQTARHVVKRVTHK